VIAAAFFSSFLSLDQAKPATTNAAASALFGDDDELDWLK
jgi:hypothetical protein